MKFPDSPWSFIVPLLICAVFAPTALLAQQSSSVTPYSSFASTSDTPDDRRKTVFEDGQSLGRLCEEDDDEVGRKLGCNCKLNKGNNLADCSSPTIKIGSDTLPLPKKLNVSRHIRVLDLSSNLLDSIDEQSFNEVSGITELNLSRNRIRYIDRLNFPRLHRLDLSYNNITNLSATLFENSAKIVYLDLSHNALTYIDPNAFSRLEYLQVLKMAFNRLENEFNWMEQYPFILNNLTNLEELDLTNGSLVDLLPATLTGTTNLKKLILKNNLLSVLPSETFSILKQLEELDLSGNYFTHLPPDGFHGLKALRALTIDYTKGLRTIEAYAFSGLASLQTLSCEYNYRLSEIDSQSFRGNPATNSSDANPKVVQLAYNNLRHFEYPLLQWPALEELELYGNPWVCDCNLQWVSEFSHKAPVNASILIDSDFKCSSPKILQDLPVVAVEPDAMNCDSEIAMMAGVIAISIFSFVMIAFVLLIGLHQFQLLPQCFDRIFGIFGGRNTLPRYHKVQPKPSSVRQQNLEGPNPDVPPDLDWDTGDISHGHY